MATFLVGFVVGSVVLALATYVMARSLQWKEMPFAEKVQTYVALLPIVVGLLATYVGYVATMNATRVSTVEEVYEVAGNAKELYLNFLFSFNRAYAASLAASQSTGDFRLSPDPDNAQLQTEDLRVLRERINEMDVAFLNILRDPFAGSCYRAKWRERWDAGDLRLYRIEEQLSKEEPITTTYSDVMQASSLFSAAVRDLRVAIDSGRRGAALLEELDVAEVAVRDLNQNTRLDSYHLSFAFFGNTISYHDGLLHGIAALSDVLTTVPDDDEMVKCLKRHYESSPDFQSAIDDTVLDFDPTAVAPATTVFAEMETLGFEYYLDDVPTSARLYWHEFLGRTVNALTLRSVRIARLATGGSEDITEFNFRLEDSHSSYKIVSASDEGSVLEMDLTLDGVDVVTDVEDSIHPQIVSTVSFEFPSPDGLSGSITMSRCPVSSCSYIVGLLQLD